MVLILGVDPGSRKTGFGIVNHINGRCEYVASGVIRLADQPLPERLKTIYRNLCVVIDEYVPESMAVEQVFMAKNAASALKLGQARGAAIVAAANKDLLVAEYEAKKVKQSVVGKGSASKTQVQHMVQHLLQLSGMPQEDAADALAVALCHANTQQYLLSVARAKHFRRGRMV